MTKIIDRIVNQGRQLIKVMVVDTVTILCKKQRYHKDVNASMSCLEGHASFFRCPNMTASGAQFSYSFFIGSSEVQSKSHAKKTKTKVRTKFTLFDNHQKSLSYS